MDARARTELACRAAGLSLGAVLGSALLVAASCGNEDNVEEDPAVEVAGPAGRGQRLATRSGCMNCHSGNGENGIGPSWKRIWGTAVELEDGRTVTVDRDYLARSTREPDVDIVEGYDPLMPSFELTDEELDDLAAYLEAIGPNSGA